MRLAALVALSMSMAMLGCGAGSGLPSANSDQPASNELAIRKHYRVTDLPPLSGAVRAQANAIVGWQVVGYSTLADTVTTRATLWRNGRPHDLGNGAATALNHWGQIVGYQTVGHMSDGSAIVHATLWEHGLVIDIGTLPGYNSCQASGINDSGIVVGSCYFPQAGFVWTAGRGIRPLPGSFQAFAINASGVIAGEDTKGNAALFVGKREINLGLFANFAVATAVNREGHAAGLSPLNDIFGPDAFFYPGNGAPLQDLGVLTNGADDTEATGISNSDTIVGLDSYPPGGRLRSTNARVEAAGSRDINVFTTLAFIWTPKTGLQDLNTRIPVDSGWTLAGAFGIDENDDAIVGVGLINGEVHGFMLTR